MALPASTFAHAQSGRLVVTFGGDWLSHAGADWGAGTLNLVLRGYVGSGLTRRTVTLDYRTHSGVVELAYTGGASVPFGFEYLTHSFDGPSSIAARNLYAAARLFRT